MTQPISLATLFKARDAIKVKTRKIKSTFVLEPTNWSWLVTEDTLCCTFHRSSFSDDSDELKINLKESLYSRDDIIEILQFFMDYTDSLYLDK